MPINANAAIMPMLLSLSTADLSPKLVQIELINNPKFLTEKEESVIVIMSINHLKKKGNSRNPLA